jgi:hypothetical protein
VTTVSAVDVTLKTDADDQVPVLRARAQALVGRPR